MNLAKEITGRENEKKDIAKKTDKRILISSASHLKTAKSRRL